MLGPSYISGCAQWGDIKDDEMLIHATRMWIATKVVDLIQQFAESIFSERILGCEQAVALEANSKRYALPNKLREIGPQTLTIRDVTAKWKQLKFPWFIWTKVFVFRTRFW